MAELREQVADNPASAYEPSDWRLGVVGIVFLGTLAFLSIAPLALVLGFPGAVRDVDRSPGVEPPPPRLQVDPARDLTDLRADEDRRVNTYYWVDKERGVVHIPIARAMQFLVERGIDGFPQAWP